MNKEIFQTAHWNTVNITNFHWIFLLSILYLQLMDLPNNYLTPSLKLNQLILFYFWTLFLSSSEKSGGIFWWWGQKQEGHHRNQGDGYSQQWVHPSREEQVEEPNEEGLQTADCFWLSHHHHLPVHYCHHS